MRRPLLVVTLSLLAACPAPDDPKPPAGDSPVADAVMAIATAMKAHGLACLGVAWEDGTDFAAIAASLEASVDAGRLLVDQGVLDACAASVAAYSCAETFRNWDEPECLVAALAGNVAAGGECTDDRECAAGVCDFAQGTCPGSCSGVAAEGEDCSALPCAAGLWCTYQASPGGNFCLAETAVAAGDACDSLHVCPDGTACDYDATLSDYVCRAPVGVGEPCDETSDCSAPLLCLPAGWTCLPLVARGQPCGALAGCNPAFDFCDPATGLCAPLPGVDQPCTASGECAREAFCDTSLVDPTCKSAPVLGEDCTVYGACADASFCDTSLATPTCMPLPGVGEDCSVSAVSDAALECEAGLFCQRDGSYRYTTCAPRVAAAGTCLGRADSECVDGHYCDFVYPNPGICIPKQAAGAACGAWDACQDDLECLDGSCTVTYCWN